MRIEMSIDTNGTITAIYNDRIAPLISEGSAQVSRASHVEPAIGGGWAADLAPVGGPILGPFELRQEALDAEVKWLSEHVIHGGAQ